ncbi:hypothetical protein COCNU_11G005060 [Cocos nucifera]|uniref:Uncharacterized protein n=1 Tax=Cocos nucifera TaxID=13894 RepID=A0A8K0N965_COCNU|nr:hypothetical protein COCNU_11G005060 [Cocos nucifera]
MDPLMAKILKKLSARRLQTNASSAQSQAFGSSSIEASDAAPLTASLSVLTDIRGDDPLSVSNSQNLMKDAKVEPMDLAREVIIAAIESMKEAVAEVVSAISSMHVVVEMEENLPKGMIETAEEKIVNADLVKKIDCSEKALSKAQEMIDQQDDELSRTHQRIEILERQRSKANRDCRQAYDIIKRLKRMLVGKRGSLSKAHLPQKSDSRPSKRPRSSSKDHYKEEASRRPEVFSSRRGPITQEPSAKLQVIAGKDQSSPKALVPKASGPKTYQKRKVDAAGRRSTRVQIEPLPAPPPFEIKESDPYDIEDSQIMHILYDSDPLIPERNYEISVKCLFSEVILRLPALDVFDFFLEEEPSKEVGVGKTVVVKMLPAKAAETPRITSANTSKAALDKPRVFRATITSSTDPV